MGWDTASGRTEGPGPCAANSAGVYPYWHTAAILVAALQLISHRQWIDEVTKAKVIPVEQPTWEWEIPQKLAFVSFDSSAVLGTLMTRRC